MGGDTKTIPIHLFVPSLKSQAPTVMLCKAVDCRRTVQAARLESWDPHPLANPESTGSFCLTSGSHNFLSLEVPSLPPPPPSQLHP